MLTRVGHHHRLRTEWWFSPLEAAAVNLLKRTGDSLINRGNDQRQMVLEDVPFNGRQRHDAKLALFQILFMEKSLIAGQQDLDAALFGCPQKFTVLKPFPSSKTDCKNLVCAEVFPGSPDIPLKVAALA
jgi:hypothetical protein